ncbi:MAG: cell division protein FtsX, partial [Geminicoccales bacterium]
MNLRHFDLPLHQSAASRFLPWTIGGLLYLAVVALAVAGVADEALRLYGMRTKLVTVSLPSIEDAGRGEREMAVAIEMLNGTQGVISAVPVPPEELEALVEPWLGTAKANVDLPLPRLIDVTLDPQAKPDLPALQKRLGAVIQGATIGVEALSRDRAERLAIFFGAWSRAVGIATLLGMLAVVGLITLASLRMNTENVELLRFMGAPDRYLARQFERHALLSSLQGGPIGFALALLTVIGLLYSSRRMDLAEAIELGLRPLDWMLLACMPVIIALLAVGVARITARWGLART